MVGLIAAMSALGGALTEEEKKQAVAQGLATPEQIAQAEKIFLRPRVH